MRYLCDGLRVMPTRLLRLIDDSMWKRQLFIYVFANINRKLRCIAESHSPIG